MDILHATSDLDLEVLAPLPADARAETVAEKAKDIFCSKWDLAKEGLTLLLLIVKNPIARMLINWSVRVGDAVQVKICGTPAQ